MSNDLARYLNSQRRFNDQLAIKRQLKIAKQQSALPDGHALIKEPNRLNKHHAMDCGNPECFLCGNPRKTHKDKLTAQEKRIFQNVDYIRDKKSNGSGFVE